MVRGAGYRGLGIPDGSFCAPASIELAPSLLAKLTELSCLFRSYRLSGDAEADRKYQFRQFQKGQGAINALAFRTSGDPCANRRESQQLMQVYHELTPGCALHSTTCHISH